MEFKKTDKDVISIFTPAVERLANDVAKVTGTAPSGPVHFTEEWPVFGRMTEEEFNKKWSGRHIQWRLLPRCEVRYRKGERIVCFGDDEPSNRYDLCSAGEMVIDEDDWFSRLAAFHRTTGFLDPRTTEELLAVFDRFMPIEDTSLMLSSNEITILDADGEAILSASYKRPINFVTVVKADDTHYQTILVENEASFFRYEWNGRGYALAEQTDIITHENLDHLRDGLTDRNSRRLAEKFISEGCPDCGMWMAWIEKYGPWRAHAYDYVQRCSSALMVETNPMFTLEWRFSSYMGRHQLRASMKKEIEEVKKLLDGGRIGPMRWRI